MDVMRHTKIVATLGPASSSEDMIRKLALAGVNVFRLNFSHGTHEEHISNAKNIRKIEKEIGKTLGIMMDLQGPKIRIGAFEDGSVSLKPGAKFILDRSEKFGNSKRVNLPHPEIFEALKKGTEGEIDADWVAISFVQTANDIDYARKLVSPEVGILAKIEKPSAVNDIDSILDASDAIMVARGDLGVEMPFEAVPCIQKMLINKAREHRKPVVVATQMLESMISCHVPTRAEVSDVACAIAEGADAVMLSAESASGSFPEEAVKTMAKVAMRAEADNLNFFDCNFENTTTFATSAKNAVQNDAVKFIVVFTETGKCAVDISNARPGAPIIALTPKAKTLHKLALVNGVQSFLVDEVFTFAQVIEVAKNIIINNFSAQDGTKIAIIAGIPFRTSGTTNLFYIHTVGNDKVQ